MLRLSAADNPLLPVSLIALLMCLGGSGCRRQEETLIDSAAVPREPAAIDDQVGQRAEAPSLLPEESSAAPRNSAPAPSGSANSSLSKKPNTPSDSNAADSPATEPLTRVAPPEALGDAPAGSQPASPQADLRAAAVDSSVAPPSHSQPARLDSDAPQPGQAGRGEIAFETLNTLDPITLMSMTEDGHFLLTSHQTAGRVSIYDVRQGKFVGSIDTPSPRSLLCRGDRVFVANFGEGTISIFSRSQSWRLVNQVEVEKPNIMHLSAPQGQHFNDELIVTCHDDGNQASYLAPHVFHVDVKKDQDRKIAQESLMSVSYDGRIILGQTSFNLSPSGTMAAYAYQDLVRDGSADPIFRAAAEDSQTPYVYQVHQGSYWLANSMIFAGAPLRMLKDTENKPLIPDLAQRVVYLLSPDRLSAHRLDVRLSEIGRRRVQLPSDLRDEFHRISRDLYRRRGYLLDHLLAYTHGENLYLFIIDYQTGTVLKAKTPAFAAASKHPPPQSDTSAITEGFAPDGSAEGEMPQQLGIPPRVAEGEELSIQLVGPPGTEYMLLSGPQSLHLTAEGRLTWRPGADQLGVQRLKIRVTRGETVAFERPEIEVIAKELAERSGGDLANLEASDQLMLDPDHYQIVPGRDYQSLLLVQGERLRRLGGDGLRVEEEWTLPERYRYVAEREDSWVAVRQNPFRLDVIDKRTLRAVKQIPLVSPGLQVLDLHDLAIHPREAISYVAIKHDVQPPRYRILIVDEAAGRVTAPEHLLGKWLAIDPQGRYLYAAYSDMYDRGSNFHINPDWRIIETPKYGSIDWLISYNLRGQRATMRQLVQEAGGNGQGLRLAPDGRRITYLSVVGYPPRSKNLAGFDPVNLKQAPVIYPTGDAAASTMLAYHSRLDLVASPGEGAAVLFDRASGERLDNRLLLPADGLGDTRIEDLWFSPDGRSLVFVGSGIEGRRLIKVGLRLTAEEERQLAQPPSSDANAIVEQRSGSAVKRSELDSLQPPRPAVAPATPKQIARRFMRSVVRVECGDSSATGFVVGKDGYILTTAHAVPVEQEISVAYELPMGDEVKTFTVKADLAAIDDERDLALLKVDSAAPLRPVMIALDNNPEAGEQVTVIGHPGVGDQVLSHTLTTGVVSSTRQMIDGRSYIQTSAAVNAGSSGGPMFDSYGRVIGLMAIKANIEGAGFAIPAESLRSFLAAVTEAHP